MSRIGFKVINVPDSVTVTKEGNVITVKGPKGELSREFSPKITFEQKDGEITVSRSSENDKALHGTSRANLASMIEGVVDGYKKNLKLIGVGYRAQAQGNKLVLNVGYSHQLNSKLLKALLLRLLQQLILKLKVFLSKLLVNLQLKYVQFVHQNLTRARVFVTLMNTFVVRKVRQVSNRNF